MKGYRRRGRRLFVVTRSKARCLRRKVIAINSNMGWFRYYVERFNKTQNPDAAMYAMAYLFCALRDGECHPDTLEPLQSPPAPIERVEWAQGMSAGAVLGILPF